MRKVMFFIGIFTLLSACAATSQPPVTVKGGDMDLMRLAGRWYGVYSGTESGRKGTIHFSLYKGTRVAEGEVVMNADKPELAKTLKIRFVRIGGNQIQGKIGPYQDPKCKCSVVTEFTGRMAHNKIQGTFITRVQGKPIVQHGSWSVVRKSE